MICSLQSRSYHVVERTRTSAKFLEMKNARAKRGNMQISDVPVAAVVDVAKAHYREYSKTLN